MKRVVEMELLLSLYLFLLFSTVASIREAALSSCSAQIEAIKKQQENSSGIHLPLHHPQSPCSPAPLSDNLLFSDILHHDVRHVNSLLQRLTTSVPLSKGTALGVGNYITRISLGTPPKPYSVVVDTGSSLSWLQCLPCKLSCHRQLDPIFDPAASSTYHPIPCSAAPCSTLPSATLNPSACSRSGVCIYEATYGDQSFSIGYLSQDTLFLSGHVGAVPNFVFGCGEDNEGLFGETAGIVGLDKNSLSLFSQLSPTYGRSFSYCLPSSSATGYLSFGSYNPANFVFTPMAKGSADNTLYYLKLLGITVQRKRISVSENTPAIIDSGTVITRLPEGVYRALRDAVVTAIGGKVQRAAGYSILDTCYKGSVAEVPTPEMQFIFAGGAVVQLPARNVMINVENGITCLAFAATSGVAIIGNKQQETFNVVYDVGRERIGFAAGGCG